MRAEAARLLAPVINQKGSLSFSNAKSVAEQALLRELCYGTLRLYPRLNLILDQLLSKGLKAKDADVRALLLIGLYQLLYMRIPDHAVLDQTVNATSSLKKKWARGFTNAILRNAQRKKDELFEQLSDKIDFDTAHPHWLYEKFKKDWPNHLSDILEANNQYPPMCLRVNQQKTSITEYHEVLNKAEIENQICDYSPSGIRLTKPTGIENLPDFQEGFSSVQDEAAQLCAPLLALAKDQLVLDACSAPGGKTGHLLEQQPDIQLTAMDISERRLADVADNLDRLKLSASLIPGDAAETKDWWDGKPFDRILLDAPCSGTGVIRRHPDIKILRRPKDIQSFCEQQSRLLNQLWSTLAENGLLLYVTCSIMPEENELQISKFISHHDNVEIQPLDVNWGVPLKQGRQILPTQNGADGFYFALLKKCSSN